LIDKLAFIGMNASIQLTLEKQHKANPLIVSMIFFGICVEREVKERAKENRIKENEI